MGSKLSPHDKELYRRTDEVLHYLWDPIGVAGMPEARDEYDGYLPRVFSLLMEDAGEDRIVSYLDAVAAEWMGLLPDLARTREAASVLIAWREVLKEKFRDRGC